MIRSLALTLTLLSLAGPGLAQVTLSFEPPTSSGVVPGATNPENWMSTGQSLVLPSGTSGATLGGFPTDGSQWGYVTSGTTTTNQTIPAGGPAPYPFAAGTTGNLKVPLPIPASSQPITLQFHWTYVNSEDLASTTYNDFLTIDLTDGNGTVLQSLIYVDTHSALVTPALTPNASANVGSGASEVAPAGSPKLASFTVSPVLAGNTNVFFEVHVGNAGDSSVDGYAHIDQIALSVAAPTYPGSGADFELTSGVNGPANAMDRKAIAPGDSVDLLFASPNQSLVNKQLLIAMQLFPTGSYPGNTPGFPDIAINIGSSFFLWSGVNGAPLGNIALPANGYTLNTAGFAGLEGLSFLFQGVILSGSLPNGYATTEGHELYYPTRIYVSATTGSAANPGTAAAPLADLSTAYALAKSQGHGEIALATGTYFENGLLLDEDISIDGGLDPQNWNRVTGQYSTIVTNHRGVRIQGINGTTTLSGLDIQAGDAPSVTSATALTMDAASVAVDVRSCSNALFFDDCLFQAGRGANGRAGTNGASVGTDGSPGTSGNSGYYTLVANSGADGGSGGSGARSGGSGGRGGSVACVSGIFGPCTTGEPTAGANGGNGSGSGNNGGPGGAPSTCNVATIGTDGSPGTPGANGNNGQPAASPGGVIASDGSWTPASASNGVNGSAGGGGGGGGGGGCGGCLQQFVTGGSGGGGGGGGGGGSRGTGGTEGGASFAMYLYNASPTLNACTFIAGQGGTGGSGGNGRDGGDGAGGAGGGSGVNVTVAGVGLGSGTGGTGGDGGDGGAGGGGGGAHGGPSFCIFKAGSSSPLGVGNPNQNFQTGLGGFGGMGGARGSTGNVAPSGLTGPVGTVGS